MEHNHNCYCGTATKTPHATGKDGCERKMVDAPINEGRGCWTAEGTAMTEFTLREQRGYSQHPCGCWSRWPESKNSIEG